MTVVPLTSMPAATTATGTELFYCQQAAADAKITLNQIRALAGAATTTNVASTSTGSISNPGVMGGLAGTITPVRTGIILVIFSGTVNNNTSADGAAHQLRYGTGSAPTGGAAATGTTIGNDNFMVNYTATTNGYQTETTSNGLITGAALNTALWLDICIRALTGGTATFGNMTLTAVEL